MCNRQYNCSDHLNPIYYRERVTQQPRERWKRDQERKLQEVEFRARSRWRAYLLTPLPHLGMIRTIARPLLLSLPPPKGPTPLGHSETSALDLCDGLSLEVMSMWTDIGQWWWSFFVFTNFYRTPLSRDIDCYSLVKISEILAGADILLTPIFVTFSVWRASTNKPVQCGRESAHESIAASGNSTLGDCTWRAQHLQGEEVEHQRGLGEVSCCGFCRAKTVRRCFHACANIFSTSRFCWRLYLVDANILSTPIFCQREYFVDTNILSTPTFCRRQYFVTANILSLPIFCRRQYFVAANILSVFRF